MSVDKHLLYKGLNSNFLSIMLTFNKIRFLEVLLIVNFNMVGVYITLLSTYSINNDRHRHA